jgi:hypothetical protein
MENIAIWLSVVTAIGVITVLLLLTIRDGRTTAAAIMFGLLVIAIASTFIPLPVSGF